MRNHRAAPEQIIGQNWLERFVPVHDRVKLVHLLQNIQHNGYADLATNENDILTSSNELRRIEWRNTALKNADGSFGGILAAGVDISELRHTIDALSESERSKSVLLSNLPGMAYRCANDQNWTMQFVSSGCFELTGYLPEELINNTCVAFNDIICPEYQQTIWNETASHLKGHLISRYDMRFSHHPANGSGCWISIKASMSGRSRRCT